MISDFRHFSDVSRLNEINLAVEEMMKDYLTFDIIISEHCLLKSKQFQGLMSEVTMYVLHTHYHYHHHSCIVIIIIIHHYQSSLSITMLITCISEFTFGFSQSTIKCPGSFHIIQSCYFHLKKWYSFISSLQRISFNLN